MFCLPVDLWFPGLLLSQKKRVVRFLPGSTQTNISLFQLVWKQWTKSGCLFYSFIYVFAVKESIMADRDLVHSVTSITCMLFTVLSVFTCKVQNCEDRSKVISFSLWDAGGLCCAKLNSRVLAVVGVKADRMYASWWLFGRKIVHVPRTSRFNHASCHRSPSEQILLITCTNLIYDLPYS